LEVNPVICKDLSENGIDPLNTYTVRHAGGTDIVIHGPDKYKHFDLRSRYSSTVYKAQGRSFETIYIDLTGFPDNITRDVLVRSLYVGASRARKKVVFIGELSERLQDKL
jgi:ATP-dependent exoDNAse (exonuclease V) alpha subunit